MEKMKTFSKNSRSRLETMNSDLILIFTEALKFSDIDFGIAQGSRTIEQQKEYFLKGNSRINPSKYSPAELIKVAKHIVNDIEPLSRAGDVFAWVPGKRALMWDVKHLCYIGGVITSTSNRLFKEGRINHLLRWGGNWDKDGEIITDQTFQDLPHFEIYKP